jgi:enoyl-CoA hydratase/carnithine racemase
MSLVEKEHHGDVVVIRMNRPEKLNAMNKQLLTELALAFTEFRDDPAQKIAILTGTGRAFCAGEDLVESAERGTPGLDPDLPPDPFWNDAKGPAETIDKPIIAAVNGWAMGGGFIYTWMCDLRLASRNAVFEISEARHWLLGAYQFGFTDTLPWSVATELALGFRMSAERAHQIGFVNRLVEDADDLLPAAFELCDHLLSIPPASLANTLNVARKLRPQIPTEVERLGEKLKSNGNLDDVTEARRAFAEKRKPVFTAL